MLCTKDCASVTYFAHFAYSNLCQFLPCQLALYATCRLLPGTLRTSYTCQVLILYFTKLKF